MLKLYLTIMSVLAGLAFLSTSPTILILSMFLIIPGLLLFVSNTAFVYGLALAPAVLIGWRWYGIPALLVGAAVVAAVAILPHDRGMRSLEAFAAPILASDLMLPPLLEPRTFSLPVVQWQRGGNLGRGRWSDPNEARPMCHDLCQELLFNGRADAIYMSMNDSKRVDGKLKTETRYWAFRIELREACPETFTSPEALYHGRIARGECLVEERVEASAADVTVSIRHDASLKARQQSRCNSRDLLSNWMVTLTGPSLEVREKAVSDYEVRERRTPIEGYVSTKPFHVAFSSCGSMGMGPPTFAGERVVVQSAEVRQILLRRYGSAISKQVAHVLPDVGIDHEAALRILTRGYSPGASVPQAESGFIRSTVEEILNQPSLSDQDLEVLRGVLRQLALTEYVQIDRRASRHVESLRLLLPDLVARMEAPVTVNDHVRWHVTNLMEVMPAADLQAYKPRFLAILDDPAKSRYARGLLRRWDLIDPGGVAVLKRVVESGVQEGYEPALAGLCRMASPNADDVTTVLTDVLYSPRISSASARTLVMGLVRSGKRDMLIKFSEPGQSKMQQRIAHQLKWADKEPGLDKCR